MKHRMLLALSLTASLSTGSLALAQARHEIQFPDIPGYVTLAGDFHMHTVFSDGQVWPTVRVDEAWRLGLDAIALTDHVEYQPHRDDLPTNHNRPFALAVGRARERGILFPRAAEITRGTPPGHFNALFLEDATALDTEDLVEAFERANEQGAFLVWNHHAWRGPERGRWTDVHTQLFESGLLHGMEVANGSHYYPQAHRWCLEKGLTMVGNSDTHGPDLNEETTAERHRTLTLVFAEERTLASLQRALVAGRTAVWFGDRLIGRQELLEPLFTGSVHVVGPYLRTQEHVLIGLRNRCDVVVELTRTGDLGPGALSVPARSTILVKVATSSPEAEIRLEYTATDFWIGPEQGLPVVLTIPGL